VVVERSAGGGLLAASDTVGALWFGGLASDAEVARRTAELLEAVAGCEGWQVAEGAAAFLMQYNGKRPVVLARRAFSQLDHATSIPHGSRTPVFLLARRAFSQLDHFQR